MTSSVVQVEVDAGVALITLNRPEARNALNAELLRELRGALEEAERSDDVAVVVLTGAGLSFCAGADLKEMAAHHERADFFATLARTELSLQIHRDIPRLATPVIAAVNGHALAGGCGLALSCDLVFASEAATFGYPEVLRGQVAALVMASLVRIVGRKAALELLLSGRTVSAAEAKELGMVNRLVPQEQLVDVALQYARELAARSRSAVRLTKELFYRVSEGTYEQALETARDTNLLMRYTQDSRAGAKAFAEKSDR